MEKTIYFGDLFSVAIVEHNGHVVIRSLSDDIDISASRRVYTGYNPYRAAMRWLFDNYPSLTEVEVYDIVTDLEEYDYIGDSECVY